MAASAARQSIPGQLQGGLALLQNRLEVVSVAHKLLQRHEKLLRDVELAKAAEQAAKAGTPPVGADLKKSFSFHLGADINVPTKSMPERSVANVAPQTDVESASHGNPFAGLPLQAWAERLGERVMPAYELIKEERSRVKAATIKPAAASAPPTYTVPHLLPFTRWAANNQNMRDTFIAEDPKTRKRARMSWYHPDDTMVPRDWFRGGLLADLKYYSPFRSTASASDSS